MAKTNSEKANEKIKAVLDLHSEYGMIKDLIICLEQGTKDGLTIYSGNRRNEIKVSDYDFWEDLNKVFLEKAKEAKQQKEKEILELIN